MEIEVTQFLLPHGRKKYVLFDVSDIVEPQYLAIQRCGCRLTAEALTTGIISLTIEELNWGDFMIRLVDRVEDIEETLTNMLEAFDELKFDKWIVLKLEENDNEW